MNRDEEIKAHVKKRYGGIAEKGSSCGCQTSSCCSPPSSKQISKLIGYNDEEMSAVPEGANLGLGCGNPTAFSSIKEGDTVLDLGSGAGFDCFLASKKVGKTGKVIGLDMTQEMITRARALAKEHGYVNVEFKLGDIEKIPLEDISIDVIISNCVINLAPDKSKVFKEAYRVLKKRGKMYVSDIVLLGQLTEEQQNNVDLLTSCVAGALHKDDYINKIQQTGFTVKITDENKKINKTQYKNLPIESIKIEATKN
jgi:ubiquinone/menaquinone biosynthesis C-methylase UbiE